MSKIWRPFGLACLAAASLLIMTSAVRAGSEPSVRITSAVGHGVVRLNAKASGPFDYVVHHPSADLYYIDLTGVSASGANVAKVLGNDIVRSYRVEQYDSGDQTVSRIEILLGSGATPRITRQASDALQITVSKQNVLDANSQGSAEPRLVNAALQDSASSKAVIRQITVSKNGDVSQVLVLGSGAMNYHEMHLSNPARLVLDFQGERMSAPKKTDSNVDPIRDVRAAQFSPEVARVVIDLSADSSYAVKHVDGGVAIEFTASEAAAAAPSSASPLAGDAGTAPASAASANSTSSSAAVATDSASAAAASASSTASSTDTTSAQAQAAAQPSTPPASADNSSAKPATSASATDASSAAQAQAAAQPSAPSSADNSSAAPSSNFPKTTEAMTTSSSQAPVKPADFDKPVTDQSAQTAQSATPQDAKPATPPAAASSSAPVTPVAPAAAPVNADTNAAQSQSSQETQSGQQAATQSAAAAQSPVPAQPAPAASMTPAAAAPANPAAVVSQDQSGAKYTGAPISVNLKNVDLQDFFRLIHEISGLNVVVDPGVKGSLTLVLDNVPWDQALDIVLKNNDLDKQLDGNVLRIATKETLRKEAEEERDLAKAQIEAADLVTTTRVLSYAKAGDLVDTLKKFLSPRGDVLADSRTNTLIISDIPTVLPVVDNLIRELDTKTQQVEIEARVVAANRSFARELGSQFAFAGSATNGRNLFGGVGTVGTSPVSRFSPPLPAPPIIIGTTVPSSTTPTAVSMPLVTNLAAAVPTSGVSYAFSSANFALDYVITAAEAKGVGKLLSKPKEIVQNNQQATIKQGTKIPVQTVINNTISTQFIDAVLELQVTPQITKDGTIFMNIHVENTQIDPAIPRVQGIPALDTQAADTRVLVADGQTVMLGGIIISNQQTTIDEVPFVGSLPIIGQLFRHTTISTNSQELLFFVTPRILPM